MGNFLFNYLYFRALFIMYALFLSTIATHNQSILICILFLLKIAVRTEERANTLNIAYTISMIYQKKLRWQKNNDIQNIIVNIAQIVKNVKINLFIAIFLL